MTEPVWDWLRRENKSQDVRLHLASSSDAIFLRWSFHFSPHPTYVFLLPWDFFFSPFAHPSDLGATDWPSAQFPCETYKWWDTKCFLSLYSVKPILFILILILSLSLSLPLCFLVHCGSFSLVSHTLFVFAFMQCFIRENRLALNRWSFKSSLFLSLI